MSDLDQLTLARIASRLGPAGHTTERSVATALALWLGAASRDRPGVRPSALIARALPLTARRRLDLELRRAGVTGRLGPRRRIDRAVDAGSSPARRALLEACLHRPATRLAVYGTLAPGARNHDQLAGVDGAWCAGRVGGRIGSVAGGVDRGLPVLVAAPRGPSVRVHVLTSEKLPAHWARLDDFEGPVYRRAALPVRLDDGRLRVAWVYVGAGGPTA